MSDTTAGSTSPEATTPLPAIVYFGNDWFAENRTSSHHIARRLARRTTLLYVDSPGMRAPGTNARDLRRLWRKLRAAVQAPQRVQPGLWHCTVPQLPWRSLPMVRLLNRWYCTWAVRRAMRLTGTLQGAVLWFTVPHPAFLLERLPHAAAIYYCIDDYAAHPGVDAEHISACDRLLSERADHVFVAPPALVAAKREVQAAVSFAPHGVDTELFARAQDAATEIPLPARDLPRPVVGYFGLLAAWTDIELLDWLAVQRPHWSFLLVGHAAVDLGALATRPNVRLVGPQPYESLPGWARAFDVAVIPYRQNQQVRHANPLKLREYLATGKPIVSVPAPEVERFGELVRVAGDRIAFLQAIEAALAEDCPALRSRRIAAVQAMSWDARVEETLQIVSNVLHRLNKTALQP